MDQVMVFVESSGSGAGEATAIAAKEMGFVPIILCRDPAAYPFFDGLSVKTRTVDTTSLDSLLDICSRLNRESRVVGVGTTAEYFAEIAARTAKALNLPGPDPQSVALCRAKDRMRAVLQSATNLNPRYFLVENPENAAAAAKALGCAVIVKPTILSGSALVRLCADPDAAFSHARKLFQAEFVDGFLMPKHVLVEEYVDGPEFSVEVLNGESIGITKKKLGPPPHFVEIGHDFPADLCEDEWNAVTEAALEAAAAVGLLWGPAHIEVKLGPKGPRIIEINPRMAGGRIPYLIKFASGFDFSLAYVRNLAGSDSAIKKTRSGSASVRFITVPRDGVFGGVSGLEKAAHRTGIVELKMTAQIGKKYVLLCSNGDRIGYIIATGNSISDSAARAEAAMEGLTLHWHAEPSSGMLACYSTP